MDKEMIRGITYVIEEFGSDHYIIVVTRIQKGFELLKSLGGHNRNISRPN